MGPPYNVRYGSSGVRVRPPPGSYHRDDVERLSFEPKDILANMSRIRHGAHVRDEHPADKPWVAEEEDGVKLPRWNVLLKDDLYQKERDEKATFLAIYSGNTTLTSEEKAEVIRAFESGALKMPGQTGTAATGGGKGGGAASTTSLPSIMSPRGGGGKTDPSKTGPSPAGASSSSLTAASSIAVNTNNKPTSKSLRQQRSVRSSMSLFSKKSKTKGSS